MQLQTSKNKEICPFKIVDDSTQNRTIKKLLELLFPDIYTQNRGFLFKFMRSRWENARKSSVQNLPFLTVGLDFFYGFQTVGLCGLQGCQVLTKVTPPPPLDKYWRRHVTVHISGNMERKRNLSIPLFLPFKDLSFFMGFQTIGHCPGGTRTSRRFSPLGKKAKKQFQPHISGNMEWNFRKENFQYGFLACIIEAA